MVVVQLEGSVVSETGLRAILDNNETPVPRFRVLSQGLSGANALAQGPEIVGDRGCLACGNCVDACPVVLRTRGGVFLPTQRTSMFLETVVGDACIRCYSCVRACPQVHKSLKNYATRFRIGEKIAHWWMASGYCLMAATGIALNHFRGDWSQFFAFLVGIGHRAGVIIFALTPLIYYLLDRHHFQRTIRGVFSWGPRDREWLIALRQVLRRERPASELYEGEFHLGQKCWYLWVMLASLVLGTTGLMRWFGEGAFSTQLINASIIIHTYFCLATDILLMWHIYRKFLGRWLRRISITWADAASKGEVAPGGNAALQHGKWPLATS